MPKFPSLSDKVVIAVRPFVQCQNCGTGSTKIGFWIEHDDNDKITSTVISLCPRCSDRIIEPHPRLYRQVATHEPFPAAMPICSGCVFRGPTNCTNPKAKFNGGPGLNYTYPQPGRGFIDGTKNGKRWGGQMIFWAGPVTACSGKETI